MVGVHAEGYTKIPKAVDNTRMAWGTDGNAFSRMAWGYFTSKEVDIIDTNSPCQLNYVIVISDGAWTHSDKAEALIEAGATEFTLAINGPDYDLSKVEEWISWRDSIKA